MRICEIDAEGLVINVIEAESVEWCNQNLPGTFIDAQEHVGNIGCIWTGTEFDCSANEPPAEPIPENPEIAPEE